MDFDMIRLFMNWGKIFHIMGGNRSRWYQWTLIFLLFISTYILIYQATGINIQSAVIRYLQFKKSRHFSIREFRDFLSKHHQNMNSSISRLKPETLLCPVVPPNLEGTVKVNTDILSYADIEKRNVNLMPGGRYMPSTCSPRHHVAILIPYRDRQSHLKIFLQNIHPFLQKQQLDYGIYVIELVSGVKFNRAMLFNIGFKESLKHHNYTCFIFHDVDLIPENDMNIYSCSEKPRHLSVAIDKYKYKLPYRNIFGGVSAMTLEQFEKVNGYSNMYFGWGGEDDDMYNRIVRNKMNIIRYSSDVARYRMMRHAKDTPNPGRGKLLRQGAKRQKVDGLNNLKYEVLKISKRKLYTWILVRIDDSGAITDEEEDLLGPVSLWILIISVLCVFLILFLKFYTKISHSLRKLQD